MKTVVWKLVQALLNFQRILCKKESDEVCMLLGQILTAFYYMSNISNSLQKFNFPIEFTLNSSQTQKDMELVFW